MTSRLKQHWGKLSFALIILALIALFTTEFGLQLTVSLLKPLLPGKLNMEKISGSLSSGIEIHRLHYKTAKQTIRVDLLQLNWQPLALLRAEFKLNRLYVDSIKIHDSAITYPIELPTVESPTSENKPIAQLSTQTTLGENNPLLLETIQQSLKAINHSLFNMSVNNFTIDNINIDHNQQQLRIQHLNTKLSKRRSRITIPKLSIVSQKHNLDVSGGINTQAPYTLNFKSNYRQQHGLSLAAQIDGNINQLELTSQLGQTATGQIKANIKLGNESLLVDGDWNNISVSNSHLVKLNKAQGSFKITGKFPQLQYEIDSFNAPPSILLHHIHINGESNLQHGMFSINGYQAGRHVLSGAVSLNWGQQMRWNVTTKWQQLELTELWHELPGQLSFTITNTGFFTNQNNFNNHIELTNLTGELQSQPVSGQLQANISSPHHLSIANTYFKVGQAHAAISATLIKHWDVRWQTTIPSLTEILPDATGKIKSSGRINGPLTQPRIKADLAVANFRFRDKAVKHVTSDVDVDIQPEGKIQANLTSEITDWPPLGIKTVDIKANGVMKSHKIKIKLASNHNSLNLQLDGSVITEYWQGLLEQFNIQSANIGNWQLQQTTLIKLGPQDALLEPLCWLSHKDQSICVQANWSSRNDWSAKLTSQHVALNHLQAFIRNASDVSGTVNIHGWAKAKPGQPLQGGLSAEVSSGTISYLNQDKTRKLGFKGGNLSAVLKSNTLDTKLDFNIDNQPPLSIWFSLPKLGSFKQLMATQPLQGSLQLNINQLDFLPLFLPEIKNTSGTVKSNLRLSGTTQSQFFLAAYTLPIFLLTLLQPRLSFMTANCI